MAEESTGSELKLIQKFINMSECFNSIFVSKNHPAIKGEMRASSKNHLMTYAWILKLQLLKCKRRAPGFREQAT